jgi:uncharacterized membrane protein
LLQTFREGDRRHPTSATRPDGRESDVVYNDVIDKIGMAIDAAGVMVIVTGGAIAFANAAAQRSQRETAVYQRLRRQLGQTILLGLGRLVAGDIVGTVAASPNLTSVGSWERSSSSAHS